MESFSYRIVEANADHKQVVLEKGGITAQFTVAEVEAMQARNDKSKKEAEAQIKLEKAKMENIAHFHPIILTLTGEQLTAAAIYKDSQRMVAEAERTLESAVSAIAENDAMLAAAVPLAQAAAAPKDHGKKTTKNKKG